MSGKQDSQNIISYLPQHCGWGWEENGRDLRPSQGGTEKKQPCSLVPQKQNLDFLCSLFPKIACCSPEKIPLFPCSTNPLGGPQICFVLSRFILKLALANIVSGVHVPPPPPPLASQTTHLTSIPTCPNQNPHVPTSIPTCPNKHPHMSQPEVCCYQMIKCNSMGHAGVQGTKHGPSSKSPLGNPGEEFFFSPELSVIKMMK